jgi:TPR repeat protein
MIPTSRQTASAYSAEVANRFCGIRAKNNGRVKQNTTGAALAAAGIGSRHRAAESRRARMFQGTIDTGTALPVEATANGDILFDLGMIYSSGRNGLIDLVAAHKWFNLAALKGRVDAISLRREVAGLMSDVEIATAQREARAWMATH